MAEWKEKITKKMRYWNRIRHLRANVRIGGKIKAPEDTLKY